MTIDSHSPAPARTIVIIGAGSGIGLSAARLLFTQGWNAVLAGRTEATLLNTAGGHR